MFAFNRVDTLGRVFEAVRAARPSKLFLICDGPRGDRAGEGERCAEVRRLLEGVDWPCTVERNYANENLGCRRRIASGIEWVFAHADEAIFLEDDTLPDATFFPYCDELLARYRDDARIQMICGYNMLGRGARDGSSYWYSSHTRIWGWASWRRAWAGYDASLAEWPAIKTTPAWTSRTRTEQKGWASFFDAVKAGRVDTWDAQLTLLAWRNNRLSVIPATSLVDNIGFGVDSTNTHARQAPGPRAAGMPLPLVHPARVARDERLDAMWVKREMLPPSWLTKLWRRAVRLLGGAS